VSYPRNAASTEPVDIGAVVQISDGAVQTSGVTVRIKPKGVSEADGAGSVAYSDDGIVIYTPTQAETDYTSFVLIAKKTGCIPVSKTVVTQASSTAGTVRVASMSDNTLTAAAIAADAGAELAALVETYIVNEGDATAVLQAVADKIAQDWIAGDASPIAIATAVWSTATRTITGGSLTTSPPTAAVIADAVWDEARSGHVTAGTFGEKVNAELDSYAQAMVTAFNAMRSGNVFTAPALANAPTGSGGGSGTGARTVTITVNDGTSVLQNATVRMTEGANTFTALTNASGVAVFNLDDATYTVSISKSGYSYAGTTLIVNGTETATYSMTAISITPPDNPDLSAIVVTCLGTDFETQSGVTIDLRIITLPLGSTNAAYPGLKQTATSNGSGIATLYAPKGSVCEWKRGKEDSWTEITIGSGDQTNVTSIIGSRY
jgi:hypothetical protein